MLSRTDAHGSTNNPHKLSNMKAVVRYPSHHLALAAKKLAILGALFVDPW